MGKHKLQAPLSSYSNLADRCHEALRPTGSSRDGGSPSIPMSERGFAIVCEGNVRLRIGVRRLIFCDFAVKELSDDPEDAYEAIVSKTLQA